MQALGGEAYKRLCALGEDTVSEIKEFLSQLGTGKVYKKSRTVWYIASAPGHPPVVKSGELKGHVSYAVVIEGQTTYLYIGTPTDYGYWLEVGTVNMEARPWLEITLRRLWPDSKITLMKEWEFA